MNRPLKRAFSIFTITAVKAQGDESGYYLLGENEKWYYTSCGNANVEMQPYLEKSGRVCYSLRQFCPVTAAHTANSITLTKGAETKTVSVTWSLSQSYLEDGSQVPDYRYLKSNGIALITIRRFDWNYEETMDEFVRTGSDLKTRSSSSLMPAPTAAAMKPLSKTG